VKNVLYKLFVLIVIAVLTRCDGSKDLFIIENPLPVTRKDEPIVISRYNLKKLVGSIPIDNVPILTTRSGIEIPSQLDDLNADGQWDELAFQYSFSDCEQAVIYIHWSPYNEAPVYPYKTNVMLGISPQNDGQFEEVYREVIPEGFITTQPYRYQAESIGWENDVIAFRNYADVRNAKDLFGKLTKQMVLDSVGLGDDYHKLQNWGMDILHVGTSLGIGGLALVSDDSLIRLGNTKFMEYERITEGPVRAIFRLNFKGWDVGGNIFDVSECITIWAGKNWFQSEVTLTRSDEDQVLAIGLVNSKHQGELDKFRFSTGYSGIATLSSQSELGDELGMAIIVPATEWAGNDSFSKKFNRDLQHDIMSLLFGKNRILQS